MLIPCYPPQKKNLHLGTNQKSIKSELTRHFPIIKQWDKTKNTLSKEKDPFFRHILKEKNTPFQNRCFLFNYNNLFFYCANLIQKSVTF